MSEIKKRARKRRLMAYQDRCEKLTTRRSNHVLVPAYLRAFQLEERKVIMARIARLSW